MKSALNNVYMYCMYIYEANIDSYYKMTSLFLFRNKPIIMIHVKLLIFLSANPICF